MHIFDKKGEDGEVLIPYDVIVLFISVPVDKSSGVIHDRLLWHSGLSNKTILWPQQVTSL